MAKKKNVKPNLNKQLSMSLEPTDESVEVLQSQNLEENESLNVDENVINSENITDSLQNEVQLLDLSENTNEVKTEELQEKTEEIKQVKPRKPRVKKEHKEKEENTTKDDNEFIVDEEIVKEKLRAAEETQNPKKKTKSLIVNSLMLALNIFVMIFIVNSFLKSTEGSDFSSVAIVQGDRLWWLALAFGLYLVMLLSNAINNYVLIKNTSGIKNFYLAYRVSIIGKYYDNITPFAVGGQPFQIITMSKAGIKPGTATSIPIIKLIVNNMVISIFALIAFIFGIPNLPATTSLNSFLQVLIKICGVIGLIICAFMGFLLLFLGNRRIIGKSFSRWLIRLGYKLRLVKDYRKSFEKFNNQVIEYQNSTSYLGKNKGVMFLTIFMSVIENLAYSSIMFAIVMAFSSIEILCFADFFYIWGICIVLYYICSMATAGIPLPGGTGMMELSFILFFGTSSLIGGTNIVWGLLFYRIFSYYIIIIHGFLQTVIDSSIAIAKNRTKEVKEGQ